MVVKCFVVWKCPNANNMSFVDFSCITFVFVWLYSIGHRDRFKMRLELIVNENQIIVTLITKDFIYNYLIIEMFKITITNE